MSPRYREIETHLRIDRKIDVTFVVVVDDDVDDIDECCYSCIVDYQYY